MLYLYYPYYIFTWVKISWNPICMCCHFTELFFSLWSCSFGFFLNDSFSSFCPSNVFLFGTVAMCKARAPHAVQSNFFARAETQDTMRLCFLLISSALHAAEQQHSSAPFSPWQECERKSEYSQTPTGFLSLISFPAMRRKYRDVWLIKEWTPRLGLLTGRLRACK